MTSVREDSRDYSKFHGAQMIVVAVVIWAVGEFYSYQSATWVAVFAMTLVGLNFLAPSGKGVVMFRPGGER